MRDESIPFYVKTVALYDGLTKDLNYNLMYSKRSMIDVVQTYPKLREIKRRMLTMDLHGGTYNPISVEELRRRVPALTGGGENESIDVGMGCQHASDLVSRARQAVGDADRKSRLLHQVTNS